MLDPNIAIEFRNVGKQYRLGRVGTGTIQHDLNRWFQTSILGKNVIVPKDKVDYWMLVDNASSPRVIVADSDKIFNQETYNKIVSYVNQ